MKKYNAGLVIGKFYPFHKGHEYLIRKALKQCKKVTVIICQTARYKIPVSVRAKWISNTFPQVDLQVIRHSAKLDSNSTSISKTWAKLTTSFLGFIPDAVFSSESYGKPYAKAMGSHHVLVDLKRKKIPISATLIRSNIRKYWKYLSAEAKPYFATKIVILGAESTGTTTLAKSLAKHYKTAWVPEYGRYYYKGKQTSKYSKTWQTREFFHIASIQNQIELGLAKQANKLLICDTNSFATELWHQRYVGKMSKKLKEISKLSPASLYILTDVDIPFVQDGTRDGEHIRHKMHSRFKEELKKRKLNYIIVSGSRSKRLHKAIKEINKVQKTPPKRGKK